MVYGATANRAAGPPDLSLEEQRVVDLLSKNFVKWTDLEELMLH